MNMENWKNISRLSTAPMRKTGRRGVATIELALLLPLAVLFLLGAVDFGRIFYEAVTVASAARAGVSYGSLRADLSQNTAGIQQLSEEDAQNLNAINVTAERLCECADGSPIDRSLSCGEGRPRVYVHVTAEKTFQTLIPYPGIPDPVTIRSEAYMRAR